MPKTLSALNTFSNSNAVNKEMNRIMKVYGAVSSNNIKKNLQSPGQHQVRHIMFLIHMVNINCLNHQKMSMIVIHMRRIKMETQMI